MNEEKLPRAVREYLREKGGRLGTEYGAKGGKTTAKRLTAAQRKRNATKAGRASVAALTPEERRARAKKAAQARWAKEPNRKPADK
jgi:hypothetical protein